MRERSDQIEREIAETRNELNENFTELGRRVKSAVDWRHQVEERPGTMLALAFGGGIILSAIFPAARRSERPRKKSRNEYEPKNVRDGGHSRSVQPSESRSWSKPSETRRNAEAFTGTFLGLTINKLASFVDSLLPGFQREFTRSKASKGFDPDRAHTTSDF